MYTTLFNTVYSESQQVDDTTRAANAVLVLRKMRDDNRPPFQIFEKLARDNIPGIGVDDSTTSKLQTDFEFFFGLFCTAAYKLDQFFVDTMVETLATNLKQRDLAFQLVNKLVSMGKDDVDKRFA